jgi:hypothetical protein
VVTMSAAPARPTPRWWQRRGPSVLVLLLVLTGTGLFTLAAAGRVAEVLPDVGKDQLGDDRWANPVGIEKSGAFQIAHIPACAAGAITRIVLWDADSEPYWEVTGPATPMTSFVVGVLPIGFTEVEPYREPPPGTVVRLVVFPQMGRAAGIRYQFNQLRVGRVVSGTPLSRYTVSGFQTAEVCGSESDDTNSSTSTPTSTTPPG